MELYEEETEPINSATFDRIERGYSAMSAFGKHNRRADLREAFASNRAGSTPMGKKLRDEAAPLVLAAMKDQWDDIVRAPYTRNARIAQLIEDVGIEQAAAIATMVTIDRVATLGNDSRSVNQVRTAIGNKCEQEAKLQAVRRHSPHALNWAKKHMAQGGASARRARLNLTEGLPDEAKVVWDAHDRHLLSALLLRFVIDCSGVVQVVKKRIGKRMDNFLILVPEVAEWLEGSIDAVCDMKNAKLPILHEPLDWLTEDLSGGYIPGMAPALPILTGHRSSNHRKAVGEAPEVVEALNAIQRTPWRINQNVLRAYRWALDSQATGLGLVGPRPTMPVRPYDELPKGHPVRVEYGQAMRDWHERDAAFRDSVREVANTSALVKLYENDQAFWIPNQLDFRGRIYPASSGYLSPQGPKHQRALLEFANGVRLGAKGMAALRYQCANTWGEDKLTLEGRQQWALDNEELILSVGTDPLADRRWREADDPFGFVAAACDYAAAQEEGEDYVSHLPVNYDGSSNGLQVLSLALHDPVGARATNCVPLEAPNDIYMEAGASMKEVLQEWVSGELPCSPEQLEAARLFLKWIKVHCEDELIPRAYMKRATMTLPYSATTRTIQKYMIEAYHAQADEQQIPVSQRFMGDMLYQRFYKLAEAFELGLSRVVVRGFEMMTFLREAARVAGKEGSHLSWTTPLGFRVQHNYRKTTGKGKEVKIYSQGQARVKVTLFPDEQLVLNLGKSANSAVPNWVHSMDAAALQATVLKGQEAGIEDWLCIHDSIGTHAGNADKLYTAIRAGYNRIFSANVVESFMDDLRQTSPEWATLPPAPEMGDLDLTELLTADYFFA